MSFRWHPLSIPIETPAEGRGGVQQIARGVPSGRSFAGEPAGGLLAAGAATSGSATGAAVLAPHPIRSYRARARRGQHPSSGMRISLAANLLCSALVPRFAHALSMEQSCLSTGGRRERGGLMPRYATGGPMGAWQDRPSTGGRPAATAYACTDQCWSPSRPSKVQPSAG